MEKINWNTYNETFPDRYLRESYFDEYVKEIVSQNQYFYCLDVGGGINGTEVLKRNNCFVTALEPNCEKSHWDVKVGWDNNQKFNLIVARGSINYLNIFEMKKLMNMLSDGGVFLANSFIKPPTRQMRSFKNETTGVQGYEMSLLYNKTPSTKSVRHYLVVLKDGIEDIHLEIYYSDLIKDIENLNFSSKLIERVIEHEFYYYTLEDYLRMFKKEITFKTYNDNKSVIIKIEN